MERDRSVALERRPAFALPRLAPDAAAALRLAWRATWLSRALIWAAGLAAVAIWGVSARMRAFDPAGLTSGFGHLFDPAARWDSVWYLAIARDGYGAPGRPAFFPLYPLLVRGGGWVLGSPLVAGVLVSLVCLVIGLAVLHELARLELGAGAARWTVIALAFSPVSFFFSAVYSESLFLALSGGALLSARRGRWWWAGALGAAAAATRSAGIVLLVPLVLFAGPHLRRLVPLALVPVGLLLFMGGLALGGHGALSAFHVQDVWFREWAGPFGGLKDAVVAAWDGVRQLASGQREHVYFTAAGGDPLYVARMNLLLFAFLVLAAIALAGAIRRLPLAYTAYVLAALALPLSYPVGPQPLMSLPRFELVLIPLWMWWGAWLHGHPRARGPALVASGAGLVVFSAMFATWRWVA
jgi:hypothetical protein